MEDGIASHKQRSMEQAYRHCARSYWNEVIIGGSALHVSQQRLVHALSNFVSVKERPEEWSELTKYLLQLR